MKKTFTLFTLFTLFTILLIGIASAEVQYFQEKRVLGNGTIENFLSLQYSKQNIETLFQSSSWWCINFGIFCDTSSNPFANIGDYITGNNPYEIYIWYNLYVQKWNIVNSNFKIDNCTFKIDNYKKTLGDVTPLLNRVYDSNSTDLLNEKYYVQLQDGDGISVSQICYFQNKNYTDLSIPAEMQVVTPTWECKSCQLFEWSVRERNLLKAQNISSNSVVTFGYIKSIFILNFEVWLMVFWTLLILLVFASLSFIFLGMFWFYKYLMRVVK